MTFGYLITREEYVSGEVIFLFSADCLPAAYVIGYVIEEWHPPYDEFRGEVRMVFIRAN